MSGTNVLKRVKLQLRTNKCSGRPSASKNEENIQKVWKMICSSRRLTVREVAKEAGISKTMCHEILTENLGMHCVAAKFVLRLLSEDQKQNRVDVSKEFVDRANADEHFSKNIISGYGTLVCSYDVETKAQFSQWVSEMSPRPEKSTASSVQCESEADYVVSL